MKGINCLPRIWEWPFLESLAAKPQSTSELATRHDVSRKSISSAIGCLRQSGFVRVHKNGRPCTYALTDKGNQFYVFVRTHYPESTAMKPRRVDVRIRKRPNIIQRYEGNA